MTILTKQSKMLYSTHITQDFINDILSRALEATSRVAKKPLPRENKKPTDSSSSSKFASDGNARRRGPSRHRTDKENTPDTNDLLDVLSKESFISSNGKPLITKSSSDYTRGKKKFTRRKPVPDKKPFDLRSDVKKRYQEAKPIVSEKYIPEEPSLMSLLKYSPNLYHNRASRMINYSRGTLSESQFPMVRPPNLGVTQNLNDENVENIAYTVESSNFGKYMPATSLTLHREKLAFKESDCGAQCGEI